MINGKTPVKGQIFKNPDLANTLKIIGRGQKWVLQGYCG